MSDDFSHSFFCQLMDAVIKAYREVQGLPVEPMRPADRLHVYMEMENFLREWLKEPELTEENFMVFLAGRSNSFRCECGCNVFKKVVGRELKYCCNSCQAIWTGEK